MKHLNLRLSDELHERLTLEAEGSMRSLQKEIVFRILKGLGSELTERDASADDRVDNAQAPVESSRSVSSGPFARPGAVSPLQREAKPDPRVKK